MGPKKSTLAGNSALGHATECPMCGEIFGRKMTYEQVNCHIDLCMTDPEAHEKKRLKELQRDIVMGDMPKPMLIKKDSQGETHIEQVENSQVSLTLERVQHLQTLNPDTQLGQLQSLPTHEKILWLKLKIDTTAPKITEGANKISVSRESLLPDALQAFNSITNLKKVLKVTFQNEVSRDVGGISREFFNTIMKELMNANFGLFRKANTETFSYTVSPDSMDIQESEKLFEFFGKLLAKAVYDRIPLNLCLNKAILNALVGKIGEEEYREAKAFKQIDTNVASSFQFLVENDLSSYGDSLGIYFTTCDERNMRDVELKTGGEQILVTESNKMEFIRLKSHYHAYKAVKTQMEAIRRGFYQVIPLNWVRFFQVEELESFMCGQATISLKDWKANTETRGFNNFVKSLTLHRFWQIMATYNQEQLGRILQFCTGTSRLPLGGFSELESQRGQKAKFCIQKIEYDYQKGESGNLPKAHTCFNRLDLPKYPDYNTMKQALDFIANNEILGFGMEE